MRKATDGAARGRGGGGRSAMGRMRVLAAVRQATVGEAIRGCGDGGIFARGRKRVLAAVRQATVGETTRGCGGLRILAVVVITCNQAIITV